MSAGQSTQDSPSPSPSTSVCDFSEEQILKIKEKIDNIYRSILTLKKSKHYYDEYTTFLDAMKQNSVGLPLVEKVFFLDNLQRVLEECKTMLEWIINLCKKYKSVHVEKHDVERDVEEFISVNVIKVQTLLNALYRIGIEKYYDEFKVPIDIITEINDRFSDVEKFKNEMMEVTLKQQEDARKQKDITDVFSRAGGSSSSRSKKRKQMKMKMKSSNYRSKTRNSKKKYNRKSVKK